MESRDISQKLQDIEERYHTKLLDVGKVSDYLGVDEATVHRLADSGQLDYTTVGNEKRFKAVHVAYFELDIRPGDSPAYIPGPAVKEKEVGIMKVTDGSIYSTGSKKNPREMRFFITFDDGVKTAVKIRGRNDEEIMREKPSRIEKELKKHRAEKDKTAGTQNGMDGVGNATSSITDITDITPKMTFREVSEMWFKKFEHENESKGNTFSNKECAVYSLKAVNAVIGDADIRKIDTEAAQEMINAVSKKADGGYYSYSHVDKVSQTFRKVMGYAFENNYTDRQIGKLHMNKNLKKPDRDERFLDKDELNELLDCIRDNKTYNVLVYLIISSGLRQEEALALTIDDVKEKNGICWVHTDKALVQESEYSYKVVGRLKHDEKSRDIPIAKKVYDMLVDYYNEGLKDTELMEKRKEQKTEKLIFVNKDGCVHNKRTLQRSFGNYLEKRMKGGRKITLHMLRHTYATNMKNKVGLDEVSDILGHADSSITRKYYVSQTMEGFEKTSRAVEEMISELERRNGTM